MWRCVRCPNCNQDDMFRFEYIDHLFALALLPVIALAFAWMWRQRTQALRRLGNLDTLRQMMPHFSKGKQALKFSLLLLALALLVVGWANPQWGTKRQRIVPKALDVFIALDISQSMLCEDVPPNRLERAKRFCGDLVEKLQGNRIGLILFAASADLHMPLTLDYQAAQLFLRSANPQMAAFQGTSIAEAIEVAEGAFPEDNKNHKVLIIVSDGESHDEQTVQRAAEAYNNGLLIFTVGVGTEQGGYIPETNSGRTLYKKDRQGNPVKTVLEPAVLKEIAEAAEGSYLSLQGNPDLLADLQDRVDRLEKKELEQRVFDEHESYFQYFLGLALLLLIAEFMLSARRTGRAKERDWFG